jgi:tetratricopeptide (TPR) repeat protein
MSSELNTSHYLERARLLLRQKRYRDAEAEAGMVLRADPNNVQALQILGHCRLDNKKYKEAIELFRQCIGLDPADDYLYYLLAFAHYQQDELDVAMPLLRQAIQLFPYNAGYFSLMANIYLTQRKYQQALDAANQGLQVHAEDISCLNARSKALFRLNKKEEAYSSIQEALQLDPEDAYTHMNYGWHFLEKGKHKKALEHFQQALRVQPDSQYAKTGLKNALKSKLPFYRWLLQYSLWSRHQSPAVRVAFIIGAWLLVRLVVWCSEKGLYASRYIAAVLVGLYLLLVLFSWLGNSFANLYLLGSRYGRYALDENEKWSAALVGISLLLGAAAVGAGLFLNSDRFLVLGAVLASLSIPFSEMDFPIKPFKGNTKTIMSHLLLLLGLLTIVCLYVNENLAIGAGVVYLIFFLGTMWRGAFSRF